MFIYTFKKKKKKLYFNQKVPKGKITQFLLNNYVIGILTVMVSKDIFKKKNLIKITILLEILIFL